MRSLNNVFFTFCLLLTLSGFSAAATFTVTKVADTNDGTCDADCSFREAVAAANAVDTNDVVIFDAIVFISPQTITLTAGEIVITGNGSFMLTGPGSSKLTISGNNMGRVLTIGRMAVANISGVTFTGGNGVGASNTGLAGAVLNLGATTVISNSVIQGNSAVNGGGLNNTASGTPTPSVPGNLTLINCTVANNTASASGGGMQNFSTSTVTIMNSTFTGNTSGSTNGGGGIAANGGARITNSTFTGNTATAGGGGGIQSNGTLGLVLTNVTVSGNTAATNAGGFHRGTTNTNATIRNSIVAGNTGPAGSPDVTNSTAGLTSSGNNVIGVVGTSTGWIASDLLNQNPLLGPLGSHGGLTRTHPLLVGSPAINAGQNCVRDLSCTASNPPIAVTADARYEPRDDSAVDIGAYEVGEGQPAVLPNARLNQPYNHVIAANSSGFTYSAAGGLPPGITISNTGTQAILSGVPTVAGTYLWLMAVTSNTAPTQTRAQIYMLTVSPNPDNAIVRFQFQENGGPILSRMTATLTDIQGNQQTAVVSPFGYVTFENVPVGGVYTLQGGSKRLGQINYQFAIQGSFIVGPIELSKALAPEAGSK